MTFLVALDRDGTINYDPYPGYFGKNETWKSELELYSGVVEGIKLLNMLDARIVVVSNQAGVARGFFDCERVESINSEINERLNSLGAIVDAWYYCPFVDKEYALKKKIPLSSEWVLPSANWRKPRIGMIEQALKELNLNRKNTKIYVIGDKDTDIQTAENIEGRGLLMQNNFYELCRTIFAMERSRAG